MIHHVGVANMVPAEVTVDGGLALGDAGEASRVLRWLIGVVKFDMCG